MDKKKAARIDAAQRTDPPRALGIERRWRSFRWRSMHFIMSTNTSCVSILTLRSGVGPDAIRSLA